jgi:hypothetical protein
VDEPDAVRLGAPRGGRHQDVAHEPGLPHEDQQDVHGPDGREEEHTPVVQSPEVRASAVVEEHGGTLTCDSRVGEGTRFHLALPRMSHPSVEAAGV